MKNVKFNEIKNKNQIHKLNSSIGENKSFNKRLIKDMSEYFLSTKILSISNSSHPSHRNILGNPTHDKPDERKPSSKRNISEIKTIDSTILLKARKIIPLRDFVINKKLNQNNLSTNKNLISSRSNKDVKLSLPIISMTRIQISPQPQKETITMKNLKLYGKITGLYKRLTENIIYK
jgi:hypothetical protein